MYHFALELLNAMMVSIVVTRLTFGKHCLILLYGEVIQLGADLIKIDFVIVYFLEIIAYITRLPAGSIYEDIL